MIKLSYRCNDGCLVEEALVIHIPVGEQLHDLPPLGDLPLEGLDVELRLLLAVLDLVDEVVAVLAVLEVLAERVEVVDVEVGLAEGLHLVLGVVLQGFHDLELGAQLGGLKVDC